MKASHLKVPGACVKLGSTGLQPDVCQAVTDVLERVGDRWSILVVHMLSQGSLRFSELKRRLGSISPKVLTSTLRSLERDGFVTRHVTPTAPPRVDYQLTALGHDVLAPVTALATWAYLRRHDVATAREEFDLRERTEEGAF